MASMPSPWQAPWLVHPFADLGCSHAEHEWRGVGAGLLQLRPNTKLLFVSGYAGKTVLDHKVVDLETNFLQKPFTLQQLSLKIRTALHHDGSVAVQNA